MATLIVYSALGNSFTSDFAYFALALFYVLRIPLIVYPQAVSRSVDCVVAFRRIQELLMAPELDTDLSAIKGPVETSIHFDHADFVWEGASNETTAPETPSQQPDPDSKVFTGLSDINLSIKKGSLVAVIGAVGSGKSSLVQAMIGEMKRTAGQFQINGSVAYCAQTAWIQNMTLRDNILFGSPFEESKYEQVVHDCALESDLAILTAGDQTEIGEKGVNLSGKKRIIYFKKISYCDLFAQGDKNRGLILPELHIAIVTL